MSSWQSYKSGCIIYPFIYGLGKVGIVEWKGLNLKKNLDDRDWISKSISQIPETLHYSASLKKPLTLSHVEDLHLKKNIAGADNLSSITISNSKNKKKKEKKNHAHSCHQAAVAVTMTMGSSHDPFCCQDI